MKDNSYTRIGYNLSTDYEELFWASITFTEGLYYAIPHELADDQRQPDQFFDLWLGGWVWVR
jgi:hypothetical protein